MKAEEILRSIVEDGFLSNTNTHRAYECLEMFDKGVAEILESCRFQAQRGDKVGAIKRYREALGCGLQAAYCAVMQR